MLNQSQFNEVLGRIGARQKLLNKDIQACAVFAIYQSIAHRNSTPADNLFQSFTAGLRKQALVNYFEMNGNLAYMKDEKRIAFFDVKAMTGTDLTFDEKVLDDNPWYEAGGKENLNSSLDIRASVAKLLKQVASAQKGGKKEVLGAEYVPILEAIAAGELLALPEDAE